MNEVFITGSSGFLGSHLTNSMKENSRIIGLGNNYQKIKSKNIRYNKIDLRAKNIRINSKISSIIHLAALSDVKFCNENPSLCIDVNVLGTKKILEICRKKDANFIFASTSHVYGKPNKIPISEKEEIKVNSIYAASKIMGENLCESYAKTYGLNIAILRFFSIYGPGAPKHNVINSIINQALSDSQVRLGNLKPKRDFVYVDDVINAIKITNNLQKGFQVFNVGGEKSFSIKTICDKIEKNLMKKIKIKIDKIKIRKNDILDIRSDCSKINKMYNWKSETSLEEGLLKTCQFYQKNRK